MTLDIATAFQIILELARQNIINQNDNGDEYIRQIAAYNMIEDIAVNEYGDE